MKDQHRAGPAEIEQSNIHRPLSHTTTVSSSNSSQSDNATRTLRQSSHRLSFPSGARIFGSRSTSPAAIGPELSVNRTRRSTSDSYGDIIPRSVPTSCDNIPRRSTSPTAMSPIESASPTSFGPNKRDSGSYSSQSRKSSENDYRRYSGTVNHYGRHSNDWLFGGFSLRDTVREGVDRLRHGKES